MQVLPTADFLGSNLPMPPLKVTRSHLLAPNSVRVCPLIAAVVLKLRRPFAFPQIKWPPTITNCLSVFVR